jgi:hypothetical protein
MRKRLLYLAEERVDCGAPVRRSKVLANVDADFAKEASKWIDERLKLIGGMRVVREAVSDKWPGVLRAVGAAVNFPVDVLVGGKFLSELG